MRKLIAALTVAGLGLTTFGALAPSTGAAPPPGTGVTAAPQTAAADELPNPLEDKRRELKETALEEVIAGNAAARRSVNGSTVVKVGETSERGRGRDRGASRPVRRARERGHRPRVHAARRVRQRARTRTTRTRTPTPTRPGRPASTVRSTTRSPSPTARSTTARMWQPDYSRSYFQNLYFGTGRGVESLRTYYEKQSSGRYSVDR